jgi:hypothetical protein
MKKFGLIYLLVSFFAFALSAQASTVDSGCTSIGGKTLEIDSGCTSIGG